MNTRKVFVAAFSSAALGLAAQACFAEPPLITHDQLRQVQRGDDASKVSALLGSPEEITTWSDGRRSMDYEISSQNDMQRSVYVNLDASDKVTDIQVISRD